MNGPLRASALLCFGDGTYVERGTNVPATAAEQVNARQPLTV
jgi:hypothetical protein